MHEPGDIIKFRKNGLTYMAEYLHASTDHHTLVKVTSPDWPGNPVAIIKNTDIVSTPNPTLEEYAAFIRNAVLGIEHGRDRGEYFLDEDVIARVSSYLHTNSAAMTAQTVREAYKLYTFARFLQADQ